MHPSDTPLNLLQAQVRSGVSPRSIVETFLGRANGNASRNTYITLDLPASYAEAEALNERFPESGARPPLYGAPVAVKDCFDAAGTVTSCGSRYYAGRNRPALEDSWPVRNLRRAGAVLSGKTHLHQLAYGITGQNSEYGDCLQPRDADLLTGGSSSGAASGVQEGSALAAVGTDTGGSVRVPAALCGLAGYRTSVGVGDWRGAYHLAESFDTMGILFRDLRDGPVLAAAILPTVDEDAPDSDATGNLNDVRIRIGFVGAEFVSDCTPEVLTAFSAWKSELSNLGAEMEVLNTTDWADAQETYLGIQTYEAAAVHRGNFQHFEPAIQARLEAGEAISHDAVLNFRRRHAIFRDRLRALFRRFDFLLLPCSPLHALHRGEEQTRIRAAILRYTTPASLAGLPVVTLPGSLAGGSVGTGIQLIGGYRRDRRLLRYAAHIAHAIAARPAGDSGADSGDQG